MLDGRDGEDVSTFFFWGAFLDSTSGRSQQRGVFGGILWYFAYVRDQPVWALVCLVALIFGQLTSYVRARPRASASAADGGLAARAEPLLVLLAGAVLAGLGVPYVLEAAMTFLAAAGAVTVSQRIAHVHQQHRAGDG